MQKHKGVDWTIYVQQRSQLSDSLLEDGKTLDDILLLDVNEEVKQEKAKEAEQPKDAIKEEEVKEEAPGEEEKKDEVPAEEGAAAEEP